jgi:hypothetical protein
MPKDDREFQGLLEHDNDIVQYPDISTVLPGVELEQEEDDNQAVMEDPEPDFCELAAVALENAGISLIDRLLMARDLALVTAQPGGAKGTALVEANDNKIIYEITFDLLDAGLIPNDIPAEQGDVTFLSDTPTNATTTKTKQLYSV